MDDKPVLATKNDNELDELFMSRALELAGLADEKGEVPIGAVVVLNNKIIAEAFNLRETNQSPLAHAEILAIEIASKALASWRLTDCTLYVTLEPCPMCAGAIVQSRIKRVVFAARDPKAGAVRSLYEILEDTRLNHQVQVTEGVLEEFASSLLKKFFQGLRTLKREKKVIMNSKLLLMWITLWITTFGPAIGSAIEPLAITEPAAAMATEAPIEQTEQIEMKAEEKFEGTSEQNAEIDADKMMFVLDSLSQTKPQTESKTENEGFLEDQNLKQHTGVPLLNSGSRIPEAERLYPPGYKAK